MPAAAVPGGSEHVQPERAAVEESGDERIGYHPYWIRYFSIGYYLLLRHLFVLILAAFS